MKKQKCNGKLAVVKTEKGYSHMQTIWSGGGHSGNVNYTSYKCEHGHEYETTGRDKSCSLPLNVFGKGYSK